MKYNLFIGRFSPFHIGHKYIIDSFVNNGKPVCIAIRDSEEKYPVAVRAGMIKAVYINEIIKDLVKVIIIPDIEQVCIGREVGYGLMEVPEHIALISGTEIRESIENRIITDNGWINVPPEVKEIIEAYERGLRKRYDRNILR